MSANEGTGLRFPPREYRSLSRVMRELDCEISDIVNLTEKGIIELCIYTEDEIEGKLTVERRNVDFYNDFVRALERDKIRLTELSSFEKIQRIPVKGLAYAERTPNIRQLPNFRQNWNQEQLLKRNKVQAVHNLNRSRVKHHIDGYACGLWAINNSLEKLLTNEEILIKDSDLILSPADYNYQDNPALKFRASSSEEAIADKDKQDEYFLFTLNSFFISRHQEDILRSACIEEQNKRLLTPGNLQKEHLAQNREQALLVAIHVILSKDFIKNIPMKSDGTINQEEWLKRIFDHEHLFRNDETTIKESTLKNLLHDALSIPADRILPYNKPGPKKPSEKPFK